MCFKKCVPRFHDTDLNTGECTMSAEFCIFFVHARSAMEDGHGAAFSSSDVIAASNYLTERSDS
jgi:hypothetical protein